MVHFPCTLGLLSAGVHITPPLPTAWLADSSPLCIFLSADNNTAPYEEDVYYTGQEHEESGGCGENVVRRGGKRGIGYTS